MRTSAIQTISRAEIVAAARKYLRRRHQHQGRGLSERGGLDCVGLLLAVAEDLGLADVFGQPIRRADYTGYGPQPLDGFVHRECARRLIAVPASQWPLPGDVLTLRVPLIPCHVAIVSDLGNEEGMIHSYAGSNAVVEHRLSDSWRSRIAGIFSFPGLGGDRWQKSL